MAVEAHRAEVHSEELIREGLADPGDQLDGFHGGHAADGARDSAKDRELSLPCRRRLWEEAAEAGRLAGNDGRDLSFEVVHRALNHWLGLPNDLSVHREALLKERRAVYDEVDLSYEASCVLGRDVLCDGDELDVRVQLSQSSDSALHAWLSDL